MQFNIIGNYDCGEPRSTLSIDRIVGEGQATGSISFEDIEIPITINFSPSSYEGSGYDLSFSGNRDNPNLYVGGAGRSETSEYMQIEISGGYPTTSSVTTFKGLYMRRIEQ